MKRKYIKKTFLRETIEYIEQEVPNASQSYTKIVSMRSGKYNPASYAANINSDYLYSPRSAGVAKYVDYGNGVNGAGTYDPYQDPFYSSANDGVASLQDIMPMTSLGSIGGNSNMVEAYLNGYDETIGGDNGNSRGETVSATISRYYRLVLKLIITFMIAISSGGASIFKYLLNVIPDNKKKMLIGIGGFTLTATITLTLIHNNISVHDINIPISVVISHPLCFAFCF